ncbi:MAG: hypothetical protein ACLPSH_00420 [Vulcanimicrobiaceae bacterium]
MRRLVARYARSRGTARKKKDPLLVERLPALIMARPDDLAACRDRAMLLPGYAGAFRRSELVALDVQDLKFSAAGVYVWIAAAKNDPRKNGRELYVPRLPKPEICPVITGKEEGTNRKHQAGHGAAQQRDRARLRCGGVHRRGPAAVGDRGRGRLASR